MREGTTVPAFMIPDRAWGIASAEMLTPREAAALDPFSGRGMLLMAPENCDAELEDLAEITRGHGAAMYESGFLWVDLGHEPVTEEYRLAREVVQARWDQWLAERIAPAQA